MVERAGLLNRCTRKTCTEGSNPSLSARDKMKKINIVYLHNGFQFEDEVIRKHNEIGWLGREPLPLEVLCQLQDTRNFDSKKYEFNIIHNCNGSVPKDAINIFPIDFQSFPISYESAGSKFTLSDFGKEIDKKISECVEFNLPNTVFLIYTSTEPYFFDANMYFVKLSSQYPEVKFVLSGSGETEDYFGNYNKHLRHCDNVSKIHKLWYLDRVHYITSILSKNTHVNLHQNTPPDNLDGYTDIKNKFLLTMRNCRSHRLLISYYIEYLGNKLNDVTYSRYFSMSPSFLARIYQDPISKEEFPYHVNLMATAMHDLMKKEKLTEKEITGITKVLYSRPHIIDLTSLNDRGVPGPWLYKTGHIALIPGGEPYGYGYVDEKQMFPMYFKKPFITVGCKGLYEELHRLDFKTFDRFWDISFNSHDTLKLRVQGFFKTVSSIRQKSEVEFNKMMQLLENDVNHNFKNITRGKFRCVSNNDFFEEVINACS